REREYDDYDQDTIGFSLSIGRQIDGYSMWRSTTGITIEQVKIGNFEDNATAQLRANGGNYFTPRIFQNWTRDSTDAFRFPTSGSKFDATFELQSEVFGAYTNAYKANISFDKYFNLDKEYNWTLRLGGRVAQTNRLSGDELGIFDRFFAGGPGTVRGFKYRDISPVDANEVPLGGESMLTATAELMIPITEQVRFVLFTDAGNVWEDCWDYNPGDVNVSVGFGFRIILPIAPISIDYGIPVLTKEDHLSNSGRVHFNLGFSY
ncbi:MAG: BamA/TamA family outer membrane protein, partial [Lentisphaeria bacterium]